MPLADLESTCVKFCLGSHSFHKTHYMWLWSRTLSPDRHSDTRLHYDVENEVRRRRIGTDMGSHDFTASVMDPLDADLLFV